jgi:hypothetical protein
MSVKKKRADLLFGLGTGEQLLWSGRPPKGIMFRASDLIMIPFSLLWAGFACLWTLAATASAGCFGLFGVPFVLAGMYMVVGRFFVDSIQRSNTSYAVTSERIIIVTDLFGQKIKSLDLRTLSDITLDAKRSGKGTISFGPSHPLAGWYRGISWPGTAKYHSPTFELIDDAPQVYEQIRQAQQDLFQNSSFPQRHGQRWP